MRFTISKTMLSFGIVVCACLAVMMAISWTALSKLEVNGPIYKEIASGMELIGDILPPPEYIIEPYLEANLAARSPGELEAHKARLLELRRDYTDRHSYWAASSIPSDIKIQLTEVSHRDVEAFWHELDTALLPAIASRDTVRIDAALADLTRIYRSHRHTIDGIVAAANDMNNGLEQRAKAVVAQYTWVLIIGSVGATCVILLGLGLIARRLTRPLTEMTRHMVGMASGSFTTRAPCLGRADELGDMAAAMETFRAALIDKERLEAETSETRRRSEAERERVEAARAEAEAQQAFVVACLATGLKALAEGNLRHRLDARFAAGYDQLRCDFNAAMETLQASMSTVSAAARAIQANTGEISAAADDLSQRTERQASSLEEAAAALDQITSTVRTMAAGAAEVRTVVATAKNDAERSGAVVGTAVDAMRAIAGSSQQISQIVGVIDDIAFQTNLLALNAGVEAARAGDSGRGFAVVASEVRALAQRSADSAKAIENLISTAQMQVAAGVASVGKTGDVLERMIGQVSHISGIISDIAASTQEQATGLQQVNAAVNLMDQATQQNAAMVEQSTAANRGLAQEAAELTRIIGHFKITAKAGSPSPDMRFGGVPLRAMIRSGAAARRLDLVSAEPTGAF